MRPIGYNIAMLIIGHRGAAGLAPENTLEALKAGFDAGADILEFDVRVTADNVPILVHDAWIKGKNARKHTLAQLRQVANVTTLESVLPAYFGKVLLNIELKQTTETDTILKAIEPFIEHPSDWDDIIFSSFRIQSLRNIRSHNEHVNIALLHHVNPFLFMKHQKELQFSAVGFHRLHANPLAIAVAQKLGIFTYVYTIDRIESAKRFSRRGIDGIVTNYPDRIADAMQL